MNTNCQFRIISEYRDRMIVLVTICRSDPPEFGIAPFFQFFLPPPNQPRSSSRMCVVCFGPESEIRAERRSNHVMKMKPDPSAAQLYIEFWLGSYRKVK